MSLSLCVCVLMISSELVVRHVGQRPPFVRLCRGPRAGPRVGAEHPAFAHDPTRWTLGSLFFNKIRHLVSDTRGVAH